MRKIVTSDKTDMMPVGVTKRLTGMSGDCSKLLTCLSWVRSPGEPLMKTIEVTKEYFIWDEIGVSLNEYWDKHGTWEVYDFTEKQWVSDKNDCCWFSVFPHPYLQGSFENALQEAIKDLPPETTVYVCYQMEEFAAVRRKQEMA